MLIPLNWSDFKTQIGAGGLPFKVLSVGGVYYLSAANDLFELDCQIVQNGGSDQTDYETNYASYAVAYPISPLSPGSYRNITGNGTTVVKSGAGVLMGVWLNNDTTGGNITIYDNTTNSGTKLGVIQVGTPSGGLLSTSGLAGGNSYAAINVKFSTGLTVVTSGSSNNDVTFIYR